MVGTDKSLEELLLELKGLIAPPLPTKIIAALKLRDERLRAQLIAEFKTNADVELGKAIRIVATKYASSKGPIVLSWDGAQIVLEALERQTIYGSTTNPRGTDTSSARDLWRKYANDGWSSDAFAVGESDFYEAIAEINRVVQAQRGAIGGQSKSSAKAKAARKNGKKGGRPKDLPFRPVSN